MPVHEEEARESTKAGHDNFSEGHHRPLGVERASVSSSLNGAARPSFSGSKTSFSSRALSSLSSRVSQAI